MSKAIYIATTEAHSGKSLISLGLMRMLLGKTAKVGYFRPIINDYEGNKKDNHIDTICSYFNLDTPYEDCFAFKRSEVIAKKNAGKGNEIIDFIIDKYKKLESKYDFILIEGSDFSGENAIIEFDINILIAKNLGVPVIIVGSGSNKTIEDFIASIQLTYNGFSKENVNILAVIANKIDLENIELVNDSIKLITKKSTIVNVIPKVYDLDYPTVNEISEGLKAKVLFGEKYINNQVASFGVGAMQLRNYLTHLKDKNLVITPGDRADIILGVLQANQSDNYPTVSGIVLTGGIIPDQSILDLIEGLNDVVPILSVKQGTFAVTNLVGSIKSKIFKNNRSKILLSLDTFDKYIESKEITDRLITHKSDSITPRMFQYNLLQKAKKARKRIVLPEGLDSRILIATSRLVNMDIVDITLIGDEKLIKQKVSSLGLTIDYDKLEIINPVESTNFDDYANTLYELRKHKNVNMDMARDMVTDVSYFGTMMTLKGHADGMVSGAIHTTQHTIRPALQLIKTKPGVSVVSSVFFMCLADRVSVFGDCAVNPNPNAEQLSEITISSAKSSEAFGIKAKVALLSYSSGTSGKGEEVEKVREATRLVREKQPNILIEGPIQYDAAVDMEIGMSKLPNSKVAGQATVFIFTDLNTGNNTYKAIQRETGALAIGPMLQGLNKPVNDLSRGCTVEDIYNTVLLTAVQAQGL